MANFSYVLTRGQVDLGPDNITTGTNAPSAGDVEVRISTTNAVNRQDVIILLDAVIRRLQDGRFNDLTSV